MFKVRQLARQLARLVARDVLYSHVYALETSGERKVEDAAGFGGRFCSEGDYFALVDSSGPLTECRFVDGDRYRDRFPWRLAPDEAVLVRLKTLPHARGRGLAPVLIGKAADAMWQRGYRHLYAMVWFSNKPSKRAFEKAGWVLAARHLTIRLRGRLRPIEIVRRSGTSLR